MTTNQFLLDRIQGLTLTVQSKANSNTQRIMSIESDLYNKRYFFGLITGAATTPAHFAQQLTIYVSGITDPAAINNIVVNYTVDGNAQTATLAEFGLVATRYPEEVETPMTHLKIQTINPDLLGQKLSTFSTDVAGSVPVAQAFTFTIGLADPAKTVTVNGRMYYENVDKFEGLLASAVLAPA